MNLRIEIDGETHTLDLPHAAASIEQVMPGVFSLLLGTKSFTVHVAAAGEELEAVNSDGIPRRISVWDSRDRRAAADPDSQKGPATIRAQMPGKIIKFLVEAGANVEAGQALIVVEAMKMQNEVKAPKGGVVTKIMATPGATVVAGETLLVVE